MQKQVQDYTIADWGAEYRVFVARLKKLGAWPMCEEERRFAWEARKIFGIYDCGNS